MVDHPIDIRVRSETMLESVGQWGINNHLASIGARPADAVWDSMVPDILPLMKNFLEKGGTYNNPREYGGTIPPKKFTWSEDEYPAPIMKLIYGNNWLLITREVKHGYPAIKIWVISSYSYDSKGNREWDTCLVHPSHLDATLCHIFQIPG